MITSINIDNQKINVREVDEQNSFSVRGIFSQENIKTIDPNFGKMSCAIKRNLSDDSFNVVVNRELLPSDKIKALGGNDKAFGLFTSINVDNKYFKNSFDYDHDNSLSSETIHRSLFDSHPLSSVNTFPIAINWMFDKDGISNDDDEVVSGMVISPQIFPIQDSFQITNNEGILFKMVKSFSVNFKNSNNYSNQDFTEDNSSSPFGVTKTYSYMLVKMESPKQDEYTQKVADIYIFNDDNSVTNQDYLISDAKYNSRIFNKSSDNVHYEPSSDNVTFGLENGLTRRGKYLGKVLIDQIPSNVFINKNTPSSLDQTIGEIIPYDLKNDSYMTELYIKLNAVLKKVHFQNFTNVTKAFLDPMDGIVKLSIQQNIFNLTNIFSMKTLNSDELKNIKELINNKQLVSLSSLESRSSNE